MFPLCVCVWICTCVRRLLCVHDNGPGNRRWECVYVIDDCRRLAECVRSSLKWLAAGGDSCFNSWADRINSNALKSKSGEHLFSLPAVPTSRRGIRLGHTARLELALPEKWAGCSATMGQEKGVEGGIKKIQWRNRTESKMNARQKERHTWRERGRTGIRLSCFWTSGLNKGPIFWQAEGCWPRAALRRQIASFQSVLPDRRTTGVNSELPPRVQRPPTWASFTQWYPLPASVPCAQNQEVEVCIVCEVCDGESIIECMLCLHSPGESISRSSHSIYFLNSYFWSFCEQLICAFAFLVFWTINWICLNPTSYSQLQTNIQICLHSINNWWIEVSPHPTFFVHHNTDKKICDFKAWNSLHKHVHANESGSWNVLQFII